MTKNQLQQLHPEVYAEVLNRGMLAERGEIELSLTEKAISQLQAVKAATNEGGKEKELQDFESEVKSMLQETGVNYGGSQV